MKLVFYTRDSHTETLDCYNPQRADVTLWLVEEGFRIHPKTEKWMIENHSEVEFRGNVVIEAIRSQLADKILRVCTAIESKKQLLTGSLEMLDEIDQILAGKNK